MRSTLPMLACAAVALAGPALAHHSGAMFDREKTITLDGVVKSFEYTQPHGWIDILVADPKGGAPVSWAVECGAPPAMRIQGITPSAVKAGEKISARIHPLKDGRPGGSFIDITIGGKTLGNARGGVNPDPQEHPPS